MIILKHNTLKTSDLFIIEKLMLKISSQETLDYSLLNKPRGEVYGYMGGIFKRAGIVDTLGITMSEFLDFLMDVETSYLDNPYHSFYHSVDTAMILFHMIERYEISTHLTHLDIILLLLAALCHDAGHPGHNNQFEVNCKTDLAIKYNNLSVLESHSATIALDLLDKHQLLRHLTPSQQSAKASIVNMILSTDMICHSTLKENIDHLYHGTALKPLFQEPCSPCYLNFALPKEQQMLCCILLHAADISSPCRPWPVFHQLSTRVCIEYALQAEQERSRGFSSVDTGSPSKINVGFIDHIVYPYFKALSHLFPKISVLLDQCARNRKEWLQLASETIEVHDLPSIHTTLDRPTAMTSPI